MTEIFGTAIFHCARCKQEIALHKEGFLADHRLTCGCFSIDFYTAMAEEYDFAFWDKKGLELFCTAYWDAVTYDY